MHLERGFIKYIVIIGVIIILIILGQQAYFKAIGKNTISKTSGVINDYLAKGANWVSEKVFPKITGEVEKRGDMIKEGISAEKEKVVESAGEKIKNYFSGVVDNIIHPAEKNSTNTQNCQPATATSN